MPESLKECRAKLEAYDEAIAAIEEQKRQLWNRYCAYSNRLSAEEEADPIKRQHLREKYRDKKTAA